jgi:hypothetical protein
VRRDRGHDASPSAVFPKEAVVPVAELTHPDLARQDWRLVRWELFILPDVRDVRPSGRADAVLIVHRGAARVQQWLAVLEAAGMRAEPPMSRPAA